ncbi:uncharacterized protein Ephrin isoform X2 [Eurosta solidaginis]|uniref:uncharacterized protein Ephrin isoform X2 n=1 Tax=Eurosta solidaginis TaxID=178769 RepID=UPI0035313456
MKLCHSNNPNTMHDTNMCTADKPLFATGNAGDLKYLENKIPDKMFRDIKDVSTKNKKTVLSDSVQNQKVTSKGIIFSFDVETAIICRNKSRQSIGFPRIKYRNCKTYRNQLRNTMVTALEDPISWNPRGLSINKIVLTRPSEVERVTSLLATPYLSSSSSLSMSSTLEVPFLIQTSLEFSVFSTQAWYQYLLLLVINLIKLSDAMRINSPVTSRETKKIVRIDNWPQRRLTVSKISSALPKRIVYSHPESRCKIRASVIPSGHSSTGSSSHTKFRLLPGLRATSFCTLLTLIFLETVLLSTVSNCAKTFYMHWNTSNSIFRIDNTDHIIDVNKGNLAFEFDQVHIICPVYEPGTFENETEKYIIYNVSKVEYETCRITNADPRVIAICDKPQKLMFFTITFRPFTPQPGGLEFLPATSSKDDLYRRIGGRCSTNNMKVVFKVCCAVEDNNKTISAGGVSSGPSTGSSTVGIGSGSLDGIDITANVEISNSHANLNQLMKNNANPIGINGVTPALMPIGNANIGGNVDPQAKSMNGAGGTSINTNIEQFNRMPIQNVGINGMGSNAASLGNIGLGGRGHGGGVMSTSGGHGGINMVAAGGGTFGIGQYPVHPGQIGIRVNNVASQHHATHKNIDNDDHFDKHPNEVVKNEELTYNSGAMRIQPWIVLKVVGIATSWHIANLSKWLLFRSRWILPSVSNINRDKGNEEQMNSQFTTQNSFYIREKGKRKIKATVKFLSFNFKEILIFFIVLFAITLLMIKFSLNSRERLNDKTNLKRTSMENFGLSNENTFVPHSWLDRFYPYTKQKFVFIELKLFHHHKLEGLTSQPAEGTIVSIKNTQPSESIQAENNKYFLSTMLIQPLIKYCHSHLLNVCVKVKKCR